MNKFKPGQLVLVTPMPGFYELTFHKGKHALYIEPLEGSPFHRVMIDNRLHVVTEGEIREPCTDSNAST